MKIAVPNDNGKVNQHFGRSREFAILELEDRKVVSQRIVSAEDLQHNHTGLADLISAQAVEAVLAGGIGPFALEALEKKGLKVITGVEGDINDAAVKYAGGDLVSKGAACGHHHGHGHSHGHGGHQHGHCGHHHGHGEKK